MHLHGHLYYNAHCNIASCINGDVASTSIWVIWACFSGVHPTYIVCQQNVPHKLNGSLTC